MMVLGEGNGLLQLAETSQSHPSSVIDKCLDNPKGSVMLGLALTLACSNAADAVEIMCVGFIMSTMKGNISTSDKEYLSSAVFCGMLIGGLFVGGLSDIIGRRPCLLGSLVLNTIAGFASAAAPSLAVLIFCRVIAGLGIGGSVPVVFSLGAELFPSSIRGKYLSIIASFWMVGAIYTAFTAWIMLGEDFSGRKIIPHVGWRSFAVVSALPALVATVLTYYLVPESPRFLVSKRRFSEAVVVMRRLSAVAVEQQDLHSTAPGEDSHLRVASSPLDRTATSDILVENKQPLSSSSSSYSPLAQKELSEKRTHATPLSSLIANSMKTTVNVPASIAVLLRDDLKGTTLTLAVIWFMLSFGSYGMATWISTLFADVGISNPYAASFIFALANLPGNAASLQYIEVYGRRQLLCSGMVLAAVSVLGFALDTSTPWVVVGCSSLFNAFSVMGWNSLDCLSGERAASILI
jgi:MFS family permease